MAVIQTEIDNQQQYLLTRIIKVPTEDNDTEFTLEDLMPATEGGSATQYKVAASKMIPFPATDFSIKKGQKLLTLWFDADTSSWTNILYPCVALEDYPKPDSESVVLSVIFEEDVRTYMINVQWAIQMPQ